MTAPQRILRLPEVKMMTGLSRSSVYVHISQGIFPRPLALGVRMVGWPSREIEALIEARIAGEDATAIRELIIKLVRERTSLRSKANNQ